MKLQLLYHPINDAFVADKIITQANLQIPYSISGLSLSELSIQNTSYLNAVVEAGVLGLLIGPTFNRITPALWFHALSKRCGLFGVRINTIPDEWGETRVKAANWSTAGEIGGKRLEDICKTYEIPFEVDGISYVASNLGKWANESIQHANNNYGIS